MGSSGGYTCWTWPLLCYFNVCCCERFDCHLHKDDVLLTVQILLVLGKWDSCWFTVLVFCCLKLHSKFCSSERLWCVWFWIGQVLHSLTLFLSVLILQKDCGCWLVGSWMDYHCAYCCSRLMGVVRLCRMCLWRVFLHLTTKLWWEVKEMKDGLPMSKSGGSSFSVLGCGLWWLPLCDSRHCGGAIAQVVDVSVLHWLMHRHFPSVSPFGEPELCIIIGNRGETLVLVVSPWVCSSTAHQVLTGDSMSKSIIVVQCWCAPNVVLLLSSASRWCMTLPSICG